MSGFLPFSRAEFLEVFAAYNEAVWPAEPFAFGLAIVALAALVREGEGYQKSAALVLAAMWLWTGIAYHWFFFAPVNGAARLFAAIFVAQGLWLALAAARPGGLGLCWRGGLRGLVGS